MLKKTGIIFFCLGINLAYSDDKTNTPDSVAEEAKALQGKAAKEKPAEKKINTSPAEPKTTKIDIPITKNTTDTKLEKIAEIEKNKNIIINSDINSDSEAKKTKNPILNKETIPAVQNNKDNKKNTVGVTNSDQQNKDDSHTNIPKYADKNLSNALEQLRDEKDQLQTEFEKLLEKQAATNELISQNETLKLEIIELKKHRDDTKAAIENELKNQQILEKLNQSLEKIDLLTSKMQHLAKENPSDSSTEKTQNKITTKATNKTIKDKFYTIKENDTLPKIANRECKNAINWKQIYTENSKTLKNENALTVGSHIKLPENCIPR